MERVLKRGLAVVLAFALMAVVAFCGLSLTTESIALAKVSDGTWTQLHNDTAVMENNADGSVTFASGTDGKLSNDMAFMRTDKTYKVKEEGFFARFTYQEFDESGDPVEKLANGVTSLRLVFADKPELASGEGNTQLTVRLNPYYDEKAIDASNTINNRNEASANYWAKKSEDAAYTIDNWFFGEPYGGEFYADGETENTILLKYNKNGDNLLWVCLNDFWYEATLEGDTAKWAGAQGQAHSFDGTNWVPYPGLTDILTTLDGANDGEGANFGFWFNHGSGSNTSVIKMNALGSPSAPTAAKDTDTVNAAIGGVSLDLNKHFTEINNDKMTFTAKADGQDIGQIVNGVWSYTASKKETLAVTIEATSNNDRLAAYFSARIKSSLITYNFVPALVAKDASMLNKEIRIGAKAEIADLSLYFTKDESIATPLTFTADKGTVTGKAWEITPSAAGETTVKITASDGISSAEITFTITTIPTLAAKNTDSLNVTVNKGDSVKIDDLGVYFTKGKASDTLTFTADKGTITGNAWSYVAESEEQTVTITASDGNTTATINFNIKGRGKGCGGANAFSAAMGIVAIAFIGLIIKK